MYPVVFFDALRVKTREDAVVRNKAVYLALGVLPDGTRDILGLWIGGNEGAKFWMKVFNDLKTRGVNDILIAVTDGLKGMPEALSAVYPPTTPQTCIVRGPVADIGTPETAEMPGKKRRIDAILALGLQIDLFGVVSRQWKPLPTRFARTELVALFVTRSAC